MSRIYNEKSASKEFEKHGEQWIQNRFANKFETIFDVGCNIGEWTRMTRKYQPNADIHMFEVVPDTYKKLLSNIDINDKIIPNGFGLSDEIGSIPVKYKPAYSAVSTSVLDLRLDDSEMRTGFVITGDQYVQSRRIKNIDYLKIDTEGAEGKVLKGFSETLKKGKVKIIQFEYNNICVLTKWMLIDSYKFLEPLGFTLGRLKKDSIEFHDYMLKDENFIGPEYIAVHKTIKTNFGL